MPEMIHAGRSAGIDVLKAVAALLIINSHLEALYPRAWMAADGMLGNTVFFFTTGYTLAGSLARRAEEPLPQFIWKRAIRLFPGVWLVALLVPSHDVDYTSVAGVLGCFLYPTYYTFVQTALPLYPLFYGAMRELSLRLQRCLSMVLILTATALAFWMFYDAPDGAVIPWSKLGNVGWRVYFAGVLLIGGVALQMEWTHEWRAEDIPPHPSSTGKVACLWAGAVLAYFFLRFAAAQAAGPALAAVCRTLLALTLPLCVAVAVLGLRVASAAAVSAWLERVKMLRVAVASWRRTLGKCICCPRALRAGPGCAGRYSL